MLVQLAEFIGRIADRRSTTVLSGCIAALSFGLFDYFVDSTMFQMGVSPEIHAAAQAAFVGLGAGAAALLVMLARRERRKLIQEQLVKVAELNHRLRNGLQVIVDSQHNSADEPQKQMVFDTVRSISESLRQLFPVLGMERRREIRPDLQPDISPPPAR